VYTITQVASNVRRTEVGGDVFARETVHALPSTQFSTSPSLVEQVQAKTEGGRSSFSQDDVHLAEGSAYLGAREQSRRLIKHLMASLRLGGVLERCSCQERGASDAARPDP
jgi:hypothetical protein